MSLFFLLCMIFVIAASHSQKKEIGHYNIKIKSGELKDEVLKTYTLYANENPSLQAKRFCQKNGIHPDGMKALVDASENMYQRYFDIVKLYQNKFVDDFCPMVSETGVFVQCRAPLDNLWILHNTSHEENEGDGMVPFLRAPYLLAEETEDTSTLLPAFLGRLFMVKNVCLTSHGHILTDSFKKNSSVYVSRFMTGKMYDDDDEVKSAISIENLSLEGNGAIRSIDLNLKDGRALLLIIPHATNFGHEFLDLYPQLFMFQQLLRQEPDIPVLVRAPLSATKMFPILHAMGLFPEQLNYHIWQDEDINSLYCVEGIITTTSSYANHVSPDYICAFREALLRNMTFSDPEMIHQRGGNILFSDRRDNPGARDLLEGEQIFNVLKERYEGGGSLAGVKQRSVELFIGNETLEETIRLFRSAKIFISVHGAQMSNMMFLSPGAILIEIQPYEFRDVDVFLNLAPALGVTAFRYTSMSGGHWTSTSVHLEHFLGQVQEYIDSVKE